MGFSELLTQTGSLQKATEAASSTGQRVPTWSTIAVIRCLVNPVQDRAPVKVGVTELVTHVVYIEYRTDITADPKARWRVVIGAQKYEVVEPYDPGGRLHHLELRVRKTDADVDA